MADKLLFLTGKLAEKSLNKVLSEVVANPKTPPFKYRVEQIGVSVAALMTPEMIARRLKSTGEANKIILPGLCQGDLSQLHRQFGIPVERGPEDLKDLPQYFGQQGIAPDLSQYSCQIFAEIVDAPDLTVDGIVAKAEKLIAQGANVIDLGCLPNKPFAHLADTIKTLKQADFKVSVDSMNSDELLLAGRAGADYLLSLTEKTLWIADAVESTPILIPSRSGHIASLYKSIEYCLKKNKPFIADAILDPSNCGLTASIVRYHKLRKKYPNIQIMMGIGNLTELTDADTTGINAILFGMISELDINAVLATSVSPHAVNAIAEADIARRVMSAAKRDSRLPRGYSKALNGLHDRRPFSYKADEIAEIAMQIKDPSFRIMVSEAGVHVFNRDGLQVGVDPFTFYPNLNVQSDASHAFYLGVELARAQIAHQLGKHYVQDEELNWGLATEQAKDKTKSHRKASLKEKQAKHKHKNKVI
jgi:dihydropteroate synthase-like protein